MLGQTRIILIFFTKNVKGDIMDAHKPNMMGDKRDVESFVTGRVLEGVSEDSPGH